MKVEETSSILAEHPYVEDEMMTKVLQRPTLVLNRNWQAKGLDHQITSEALKQSGRFLQNIVEEQEE